MERESVFAGYGFQHIEGGIAAHTAKGHYASVGYRYPVVRNDLGHIELGDHTQAIAVGAGSLRGIEREGIWRWQRKGDAGVGADEIFAEVAQPTFPVHPEQGQRTFALGKGRDNRRSDTLAVFCCRNQLVDHQFYEVRLVAVEGLHIAQVEYLSVYADLGVASLDELLEEVLVMTFAPLDYRSEQQEFLPFIFADDQVDYHIVGVLDHLLACGRGICGRGTGVEQTEEIVDFSHRSDGGTGIAAGGLLLYGDDGTQATHVIDLGTLHYAHKLAGVWRKRVHIPALAFGVDGVECERRLAAAGEAGDHDKPVPRNLERDILQIVRLRTCNLYEIHLSAGMDWFSTLALSWWDIRGRDRQ